jgi:hypothetical protein
MEDATKINESIEEIKDALRSHKVALEKLYEEIARIDGVMTKFHKLHGVMLKLIK